MVPGSYLFEDGVVSAGLPAVAEDVSVGFEDVGAEELLDLELPAPDDFRA